MAGVKVNFSVDSSQAKTGINNVKQQINGIKNSGNSAINQLDNMGKATDGAVRALDSLAGATGLASTGFSGLAGDIIQLAKNPKALFIAAAAAITAALIKLYDTFTQSDEQFAAMIQAQAASFEKSSSRLERTLQKQQKYFSRLKQLGKLQSLTNEQRTQAITILSLLGDKYGDLGVQIDKTTGKLKNLSEAEKQFVKKQYAEKIADKKRQLNLARKSVVGAVLSDVEGQAFGADIVDYIAGAGYRSMWNATANRLRDADVKRQGMFFEIPFTPSTPISESEEATNKIQEFREKWNEAARNKDTEGIINLLTNMLSKPTIRVDSDLINGIEKVIEQYQNVADKEKQLKELEQAQKLLLQNIDSHQSQERKNRLKTYSERFKSKRDSVRDNVKDYKKALQEYKEYKNKMAEQEKFGQMNSLQQLIYSENAELQSIFQLDKMNAQLDEVIDKYQALRKAKEQMQENVRKNPKLIGNAESIYNFKPYINMMQRLKQLSADMVKRQQQINEKTKQTYDWTKKVQDLKKQREQQYDRTLSEEMKKLGDLGFDKLLKIQTNSLTARGGWAGGVNNMTTLIDINKRIANYSQKQMAVLKDINDKFSDVGRI